MTKSPKQYYQSRGWRYHEAVMKQSLVDNKSSRSVVIYNVLITMIFFEKRGGTYGVSLRLIALRHRITKLKT
jgi:hypothetical protein